MALTSILAMMVVYPASVAAACPGGGEIEERPTLLASPTSIDFSRVGEENVTFQFRGPGTITTASEGARLGGREPEDYAIAIDRCRGVTLRNLETCTVFGVGQQTERRSSATLTLRSSEGTLSKTINLIGG